MVVKEFLVRLAVTDRDADLLTPQELQAGIDDMLVDPVIGPCTVELVGTAECPLDDDPDGTNEAWDAWKERARLAAGVPLQPKPLRAMDLQR